MAKPLLEIKKLSAGIADSEDGQILHKVSLKIKDGETHVLMGPNGAGKSTLGHTIMGNPAYEVLEGQILLDGEDITAAKADERARRGLFLSFQNPLEVPGLSLEAFLRGAIRERTGRPLKIMTFKRELEAAMKVLQMEEAYAARDLNVGFSGGEKKKAEILQLLMLNPRLAILDETDSGLDVDAVRTVSEGIRAYQEQKKGALLIITHSTRILEALHVDKTHILVRGHLMKSGDASLVEEINEKGFETYIQEEQRKWEKGK